MTDAVSSLSTFLLTSSFIQSNNTSLNKLSQQLSTGQTASSLVDYGSQAQTVLNLAAGTQTVKNYQQSNAVISTYLQAYNNTLDQLQTDGNTLSAALQSFSVNDPSTVANLSTVLNGVMADLDATLNTQVDNRYVFGGTGARLTQAPVTDNLPALLQAQATTTPGLPATAPTYTDPSLGFIVAQPGTNSQTAGTLPFYDSDYQAQATPTAPAQPTTASSPSVTADSYGTQTATIGDNRSLTFGISSNDPSIQALIYTVQNAYYAVSSAQQAQASSTPAATAAQLQANARTYVGNAQSSITTALYGGTSANNVAVAGLQTLIGQVSTQQATVTNVDAIHTQTLANLQTQTSSIEAVDTSTVAEEISALENQLNASYKVTSSIMNMSLLTYL